MNSCTRCKALVLMLAILAAAGHGAEAGIVITKVTNSANLTNDGNIQTEIPNPGGLATIFCTGLSGTPGTVAVANRVPLPLQLAGISVDVFSSPSPILAVAFMDGYQQINIQVAWEAQVRQISGSYIDYVEVRQNGQYAQTKIDGTASEGFLFADGNGYGIVQHSDYSLVTPGNPAHRGEVLVTYATGLGPVNIPVQTGSSGAPGVAQVPRDVMVSGMKAAVYFEGFAGFVGVFQINFQVPDGAPLGDSELKLSNTVVVCSPFGFPPCQNGSQPMTVVQSSPGVKLPIR